MSASRPSARASTVRADAPGQNGAGRSSAAELVEVRDVPEVARDAQTIGVRVLEMLELALRRRDERPAVTFGRGSEIVVLDSWNHRRSFTLGDGDSAQPRDGFLFVHCGAKTEAIPLERVVHIECAADAARGADVGTSGKG